MKKIERDDLLKNFQKVDTFLNKQNQKLRIIAIGGVSIILQGFRDRATLDIDIVNNQDAVRFQKICFKLGMDVDIITVASTVDFQNAPTIILFQGKRLTVDSVTPQDLVKLKLERFRKQDPEDGFEGLQMGGLRRAQGTEERCRREEVVPTLTIRRGPG